MEAERLELVGVTVLGTVTALGVDIIRDVLIGATTPATFRDLRYLAVALASAVVAFVGRRFLRRVMRLINLLGAAGLNLFCATSTVVAFSHGRGPFQSTILSAITGVGGETIRNITIHRVPTVLTRGLYAIPALVGAAITAAAFNFHAYDTGVAIGATMVCFVIRLAGLHFNLNVPIADPSGHERAPDDDD